MFHDVRHEREEGYYLFFFVFFFPLPCVCLSLDLFEFEKRENYALSKKNCRRCLSFLILPFLIDLLLYLLVFLKII